MREFRNEALVVQVGDRFFWKYKNNKMFTAWCLAGAKLFQFHDMERCEAIMKDAIKRRKKTFCAIYRVEINELIKLSVITKKIKDEKTVSKGGDTVTRSERI